MPADLPTYSLKVVDGKIQLLDGAKVVSEATLPTTDAVSYTHLKLLSHLIISMNGTRRKRLSDSREFEEYQKE